MGLREILKKQGFTDEQIKAIMDDLAEHDLHVSSVENPEETIRKLQEEKEKLLEAAKQQKEVEKPADPPDATAAEEIRKLQETIQKGKIDTQLIVALTKARATDVDYLMYQAEKTGEIEKIKVGEDGKVTGVDDLVAALKKNHAAQFETTPAATDLLVREGVKKLETSNVEDTTPQTLEEAIAQKYSGDEE